MTEPLDASGSDLERDVLRLMLRTNADLLFDRLEHGPVAERGSVDRALAAATSLGSCRTTSFVALVRQARSEASSWAAIGYALQVSRQAAFQRFGSRIGEIAEIGAEVLADAPDAGRAIPCASSWTGNSKPCGRTSTSARRLPPPRSPCSSRCVRGLIEGEWARSWNLARPSVTSRSGYTVVDIPIIYRKGQRKGRVASRRGHLHIAGFFVLTPKACRERGGAVPPIPGV